MDNKDYYYDLWLMEQIEAGKGLPPIRTKEYDNYHSTQLSKNRKDVRKNMLEYAVDLGKSKIREDEPEPLDRTYINVINVLKLITDMDDYFKYISNYEQNTVVEYEGQMKGLYKQNFKEYLIWLKDEIQTWQDKGCKIFQSDKEETL